MNARLLLASAVLTLSGLGSALVAPATMAAACDDGHWPASVQGRPTLFHAGGRGGDYVWHDGDGWHLRVTHPGSAGITLSGQIVSSAPLDGDPVRLEAGDVVTLSLDRKTITYRFTNYGGVDGFDFRTSCAQRLTFLGKASGERLPRTRIWLGSGNEHPLENPFVVIRVG
jgi:hypothetical protein